MQQQQQQSATNPQMQAGLMQQPPAVVSTKDSLYLNDMLSWNLLAMKKAHFFSAQCQDQELKMELDKCGQMHQRHYEKILSHLNQPSQQQNLPN